MFLTDEEVESRLSSSDNIMTRLVRPDDSPAPARRGQLVVLPKDKRESNSGRTKGAKNLTPMMREIIGTAAHFDKAQNVADSFGVSHDTVGNCKAGRIGSFKNSEELKAKIEKNLDSVKDLALNRLMKSLNLLDDEKLENCNAPVLSKIAADMSRVVEKVTPKSDFIDQSTKILVYRPRQNAEEDYEIIEAPIAALNGG